MFYKKNCNFKNLSSNGDKDDFVQKDDLAYSIDTLYSIDVVIDLHYIYMHINYVY